ncbi:hypothetical protein N2K95_12990 [Arthrobacter zhaoxinii]|uniref:Uncharacterized protein n=1 Tax=Arthrobacter zhaoxinii TaxID=2964616 RepID=A0ABY5YR96_9MICC|nr:hypothetical protein [Arthrobacter zhaoxinii]UWX96559.1 hypothetical protein N2K95_12990 [Arthrobacter zhaoxinii]
MEKKIMNLFGNRAANPRLIVREIFASHPDPDQAAVAWSRSVAREAGLDLQKDQVRLIRELRKRDTSLDLACATFMVQEAARK